ncbi:MAG: hypothetical protein J6A96_05650 [Clostridia bacterium]|nr:hypothetical protein [Clostridia bacterium]
MSIKNTNFSFEKIDDFFNKSQKIFFIGIGGVSMSSLATYCLYEGKKIFGYDEVRSEASKKLEPFCHIKYCSTPDSVCNMDLVVFSNAISESCFEYKKAIELGIPTLSRANFLGYIISKYKTKIGISGSHGKSTTVSFLAKIFEYASLSPCVFCGATMKDYGSTLFYNKKDICIFEACEYMDSFLSLPADLIGVTNVDFDHPDYFKSLDDVKRSFSKFTKNAKSIFINLDDKNSHYLKRENAVTYAIDCDADYKGVIKKDAFDVYYNKHYLGSCKPKNMCKHFLYDALCAFSIAHSYGIDNSAIFSALEEADGVKRRLEKIGKLDTGTIIFEDYAHHPREIECTISALHKMGYKRIFCLFEAHTYSRTFYLYEEFKKAFLGVHSLYLLPVYSAREKNAFGIETERLASDLGATVLTNKAKIKDIIKKSGADVAIIMGAGTLGDIKKYL